MKQKLNCNILRPPIQIDNTFAHVTFTAATSKLCREWEELGIMVPPWPHVASTGKRFRVLGYHGNGSERWKLQAERLETWHSYLTGRAAGYGNGSPMVSSWFCNNLRLNFFFFFILFRDNCSFFLEKRAWSQDVFWAMQGLRRLRVFTGLCLTLLSK